MLIKEVKNYCALSDPRGIESWATLFFFFFKGKSNVGAFPKAQISVVALRC